MFITILIDLVELKIGCKINKFFTHHREQIPIIKSYETHAIEENGIFLNDSDVSFHFGNAHVADWFFGRLFIAGLCH